MIDLKRKDSDFPEDIDEEINFDNIKDEDANLLSKFKIIFTKFTNEETHTECKNSYIYIARHYYENGNQTYCEYIDECYVYKNDINKMEFCAIPNPQENS